MRTKAELFASPHGVNSFHDVLVELKARDYSDDELKAAFDQLPIPIQDVAFQWGLADTVFRDDAFVFFRDSMYKPSQR